MNILNSGGTLFLAHEVNMGRASLPCPGGPVGCLTHSTKFYQILPMSPPGTKSVWDQISKSMKVSSFHVINVIIKPTTRSIC